MFLLILLILSEITFYQLLVMFPHFFVADNNLHYWILQFLYPVLVLLGTTILFSKIDIDDSEDTWISYWVYPSKSRFHTKYSGSARERSLSVILLLVSFPYL